VFEDERSAISVTPLSANKRTGSFASSGYPDFAVSMVLNILMHQQLQNVHSFVKEICSAFKRPRGE
jgi:hypothetical protein